MVEEKNMFTDTKKYDTSWRPKISGVLAVSWLIFIIAWLAFFSAEIHPYEKKIAIILLSLLILIVLIGSIWIIWSIRLIPKGGWQMMHITGFRSRIITSIILPLIGISGLIYYFWNYNFTIWQHIAVIMILILSIGLILSFVWTSWKKKTCSDFEEKMEKMGEDIGKKIEDAIDKKFNNDNN
jgi:hypothetical protein